MRRGLKPDTCQYLKILLLRFHYQFIILQQIDLYLAVRKYENMIDIIRLQSMFVAGRSKSIPLNSQEFFIDLTHNYPFGKSIPQYSNPQVRCRLDFHNNFEYKQLRAKIDFHSHRIIHPTLIHITKAFQSHKQRYFDIFLEYVPHSIHNFVQTLTIHQINQAKQKLFDLTLLLISFDIYPSISQANIGFDQKKNIKLYLQPNFHKLITLNKSELTQAKILEINNLFNQYLTSVQTSRLVIQTRMQPNFTQGRRILGASRSQQNVKGCVINFHYNSPISNCKSNSKYPQIIPLANLKVQKNYKNYQYQNPKNFKLELNRRDNIYLQSNPFAKNKQISPLCFQKTIEFGQTTSRLINNQKRKQQQNIYSTQQFKIRQYHLQPQLTIQKNYLNPINFYTKQNEKSNIYKKSNHPQINLKFHDNQKQKIQYLKIPQYNNFQLTHQNLLRQRNFSMFNPEKNTNLINKLPLDHVVFQVNQISNVNYINQKQVGKNYTSINRNAKQTKDFELQKQKKQDQLNNKIKFSQIQKSEQQGNIIKSRNNEGKNKQLQEYRQEKIQKNNKKLVNEQKSPKLEKRKKNQKNSNLTNKKSNKSNKIFVNNQVDNQINLQVQKNKEVELEQKNQQQFQQQKQKQIQYIQSKKNQQEYQQRQNYQHHKKNQSSLANSNKRSLVKYPNQQENNYQPFQKSIRQIQEQQLWAIKKKNQQNPQEYLSPPPPPSVKQSSISTRKRLKNQQNQQDYQQIDLNVQQGDFEQQQHYEPQNQVLSNENQNQQQNNYQKNVQDQQNHYQQQQIDHQKHDGNYYSTAPRLNKYNQIDHEQLIEPKELVYQQNQHQQQNQHNNHYKQQDQQQKYIEKYPNNTEKKKQINYGYYNPPINTQVMPKINYLTKQNIFKQSLPKKNQMQGHLQYLSDHQSIDTYHEELGQFLQMPKINVTQLRQTTKSPPKIKMGQLQKREKLHQSVGFSVGKHMQEKTRRIQQQQQKTQNSILQQQMQQQQQMLLLQQEGIYKGSGKKNDFEQRRYDGIKQNNSMTKGLQKNSRQNLYRMNFNKQTQQIIGSKKVNKTDNQSDYQYKQTFKIQNNNPLTRQFNDLFGAQQQQQHEFEQQPQQNIYTSNLHHQDHSNQTQCNDQSQLEYQRRNFHESTQIQNIPNQIQQEQQQTQQQYYKQAQIHNSNQSQQPQQYIQITANHQQQSRRSPRSNQINQRVKMALMKSQATLEYFNKFKNSQNNLK